MSTVRTIVPPGVAQANQLKLRVSALEAENVDLRNRITQLLAICAGQAPPAMPAQQALAPGASGVDAAAGAPRMLAGAEGIPSNVMADMLAQLAAPIPNASQRIAAAVGNGVHVSGDGSQVRLMTRDDAAALARQSQAQKLTNGGGAQAHAQPAMGQVFQTPQGGTVRMMPRPSYANAATPNAAPPSALPFNGQAMPPAAWAQHAARQAQAQPAQPAPAIAAPITNLLPAPTGPVIDTTAYEVAELGAAGRTPAPVSTPATRPPFAGSGAGKRPAFRE